MHKGYFSVSLFYTDRPVDIPPTSAAFLDRFPVPKIGIPYIFGKFRAWKKCLRRNFFQKSILKIPLLMGEKMGPFFRSTLIYILKVPSVAKYG